MTEAERVESDRFVCRCGSLRFAHVVPISKHVPCRGLILRDEPETYQCASCRVVWAWNAGDATWNEVSV